MLGGLARMTHIVSKVGRVGVFCADENEPGYNGLPLTLSLL